MSAFPALLSLINVYLDHSFINDVERIAVSNYEPTDDDVIRARLRTLGVQEYKFIFELGKCAILPSSFVIKHATRPHRWTGMETI